MEQIMSIFKQQSCIMPVNPHRSIAFDKPNTLFYKLHVIVILLSFFFCHNAFAQREKIDSLKKVLPSLHDSARVDCLNELSGIYLKSWNDSAKYYAIPAYNESKKINYIHGIAEALSYKGELEDLADNFAASEKLYREAVNWYRSTSNKRRLSDTYFDLGFSLYAQSFFKEGINNLDTAYLNFKKIGDESGMFWSTFFAGHIYEESGNYEKAFELDSKGLDLAIQNNNDEFRRAQLSHMALLFIDIEDYKTAEGYFRQAYENVKPEPLYMANLFTGLRQYDSAKYYYSLTDTSTRNELRKYLAGTGEYYFAQKEYTKALPNFLRSLGLNLANQTGAKQFIRDGNQILYSIYDARHQTDSAYHYYREYIKMKDSILNDKVKAKLIAYGPKQKIELLNKEKEIQQAQLQKESLWRKFLISGIIVLMLFGIIIIRVIMLKRKNEAHKRELAENELQIQKLESEGKEESLKHQASELEMQALRAQMNPHFIFNSLNSINRFILQNNKTQASEYLTKFSRLVRLILQNSQAAFITLESELEALQLYLELEAVRFDYQFEYRIIVDEDVDVSIIKVPPLIIQPYAENAIWHGLMHKKEKGFLEIKLFSEENTLFCKITDNGIGRNKASELKSKSAAAHKSMGLRITADRIARLQQNKVWIDYITVNDLILPDGSAAGTEVLLKIPLTME